jgi:exodeoxyribonuclease-1
MDMSISDLKQAMKKNPKFLRTVRHNKHPIIMNPTYGNTFDEYKMLGKEKLSLRAKLIRENKKFAEKISIILQEEVDEKELTKSQEDIYEEESIYSKFTGPEDNKIMPEFHNTDWANKINVLNKFKDERLQYFGKRLIYEEKPDLLPKNEYDKIHKSIAKRLLSTNNEKWNTIPRTYSEIDTLREKFEREGQPERLAILDDINAYVEELEKFYTSV